MSKKNTTRRSSLLAWADRNLQTPGRAFLCLAIAGAVLFTLSLTAAHLTRPYIGDDVVIQQVIQSRTGGNKLNVVVGHDSFALKIPAYLLLDILIQTNSRLKLFSLVLLFSLSFYALFLVFLLYYGKHFGYTKKRTTIVLFLLPFVSFIALSAVPGPWTNSSDISWISNFMKVNLRNVELAIALLFALAWAQVVKAGFHYNGKNIVAVIGSVIFAGFYLYSDPYFLYTLVVALLLTAVILWLTKSKKIIELSLPVALLIVSVIIMKLFEVIIPIFGLHTASVSGGTSTTDFLNIFQYINNTLISLFKMFNAYPWNINLAYPYKVLTSFNIMFAFNSLLVAVSVAGLVYAIRRTRMKLDIYRLTIVAIAITTVAVFLFSNNSKSTADSRYIMLAIVSMLPLAGEWLVYLMTQRKYHRLLILVTAGLVLTIGLNTAANVRLAYKGVRTYQNNPQAYPNAVDAAVINLAMAHGAYKGYGSYWNATTQTYLSNRSIVVLPTKCDNGIITLFPYLRSIDDASIQAEKSFYLTNREPSGSSSGYCGGSPLEVFGRPEHTIPIDHSYTMYIYNYDIGEKIPN